MVNEIELWRCNIFMLKKKVDACSYDDFELCSGVVMKTRDKVEVYTFCPF
jgi:hypothetical protein